MSTAGAYRRYGLLLDLLDLVIIEGFAANRRRPSRPGPAPDLPLDGTGSSDVELVRQDFVAVPASALASTPGRPARRARG